MRRLILALIILFLFACTEEYSIAEFADEFSDYESELRIEAILHPNDFMNSIVRIDKTLLVTDTSLFNDIDDNGNWTSYTDENGNGQWDEGEPLNDDIGGNDGGKGNGIPDPGEPNVDEISEILPFVHDSTMNSVKLIEKATGILVAELEWNSKAGILEEYKYDFETDKEWIEIYSYGGYVPQNIYNDVKIDFNKEYEFLIESSNNELIAGTTKPFTPAKIINDAANWVADTLVLNDGNDSVNLITDMDVSLCNFTIREVINADSLAYLNSFYFPPQEIDESNDALFQLSRGFFPFGLSELTISVLSREYSQYIISSLPLDDPELSNLRDQYGNVILGIAGSSTVTKLYVINSF